MGMTPDFASMNETDVREVIVRPLIESLGYRHGAEEYIRTEQTLRYAKAFLGRKKLSTTIMSSNVSNKKNRAVRVHVLKALVLLFEWKFNGTYTAVYVEALL